MSYVQLGQGSSPSRSTTPLPSQALEQRTSGGVSYLALPDLYVSPLKSMLIGWQVRASKKEPAFELAQMTPYVEFTGPRDPGDGFRWVDERRTLGYGIIIVPPAGYSPGQDIMRATTGELKAVASSSLAALSAFAAAGASPQGFVLYEPKSGWAANGQPSGAAVPPRGKTAAIVVAAAGAALVLGYAIWRGISR